MLTLMVRRSPPVLVTWGFNIELAAMNGLDDLRGMIIPVLHNAGPHADDADRLDA